MVFLVGTCVTLVLSWRDDRVAFAAAPIGLAMVSFGLFFGSTSTSEPIPLGPLTLFAPVETAIGIAALVVTLLWLAWRTRDERVRALQRAAASSGVRISRRTSAADRRRTALGAGMLATAVVLVAVVVPFAARGADRTVLRSTVGPEIELAAEASPLSSYRSLFGKDRADEVLFAVSRPRSGAPSRIRLATLDSYDGEVFRAGGGDSADQAHFVRVPASLDGGEGERVRARIAIDALDGIWMPTAGRLASATFAGDRAASLADGFYYSAAAAAGVQTAGERTRGRRFLRGRRRRARRCPALADIDAPGSAASGVEAPESLTTWVERHRTGSGGAALEGLVALLRERGYLSHGLSLDDDRAGVGGGAARLHVPAERIRALARADRHAVHPPARARDRSAGRGIRQLCRGDRRRRAVRRRRRPHRARTRIPVARGHGSAPDARPIPDSRRARTDVCRAQDLAAWTEVQDEAGRWVPVDVTPQYENSPSLEVTEQRDPENVTEVRPDSVEEVLPPDPVQEDSGAEDSEPPADGLDLAWLGPALRVTGDRAGGLRPGLRPVPHGRSSPRRSGAADAAGRALRPRASRADGTSTWMPRSTPDAGRRTRPPGPSSPRSTPPRPELCSPRRPTAPSSRTPR